MVEIIPRKPKMAMPLRNVPLFIAGALLLAAVLGYAIMLKVQTNGLLAVQDLEGNILKVGTRKDRAAEELVFKFEKKIKDFKSLLAGRNYSSNFFDNFASLIHPKIWFSSFELDLKETRAIAAGSAADFKTLEQQLIFLKSRTDLVKGIELSNVVLGSKGEVDFSFIFNFTPEIFEVFKK